MSYQYQYSNQIGLDWLIQNMQQFLFPDLSRKKDRIKKAFSGVVASANQHPVGLILSTYDQSGKTARIHSFKVLPSHRNQGVGKRLLQELEATLAQEGCTQLDGYFRSHWQSADALRALLAGQGWQEPQEDLVIVKGAAKDALPILLPSDTPLPEGYHLTPWTEITDAEQAFIKQKKHIENWYPDMLTPFVYEHSINPVASFAVRYQDEIVGWVVSHLISPTLNEFVSIFIDEKHRPFRLTHIMMRRLIDALIEAGIPDYLITAKADNRVMSRFLIRNWQPTQCFITRSYHSWKPL